MLAGVMLASLLSMVRCLIKVALREVGVVSCLHVVAGFVMLRCLPMMFRSVLMVFGCLMMM